MSAIDLRYRQTFRTGMKMAQPNVVREPSMEEILASIRRIIENNEPVENADISAFTMDRDREPESIELTIDDDIAVMSGASAAPVVEPAESVVTRGVAERSEAYSNRPMSLADVAARVKAAADRRAPANDSEDWHKTVPTPTISHEEREPAETFLVPANLATPKAEPEAPLEVTEPASFAGPEMMEAHIEMQDVKEDVPHQMEAAAVPDVEIEVDPMERFTAQIGHEVSAQLVSATTEEKVSRSFEELVEALGGSDRSLDELAEDMLKPMLQEWLDDNLPTLVERLVREEIERVARGPRR
jgi:uncharacterized protein